MSPPTKSNSVNPLNWGVPIVNPNGTPTKEFMRKWAQQASANAAVPSLSNAAAVSAYLDLIGATTNDILIRGAITWGIGSASQLLDILASVRGSVLYRGAAGWVGLSPDTAGKVLTDGGPGADPSWQAAGGNNPPGLDQIIDRSVLNLVSGGSGGGGGGSSKPVYVLSPGNVSSGSAIAFAAIGSLLTPLVNCSVIAVNLDTNYTAGGTYQIGIAPYNRTTNEMTSAPTYSAAFTPGATGRNNNRFAFTAAFAMTAAADYIVFMVRTDGTGTTSTTMQFVNENISSPGFYMVASDARAVASTSPLTTDVWAPHGLTGLWGWQIEYELV